MEWREQSAGGSFFHGRPGEPGGPGIALWARLDPSRPETANRAFSRSVLALLQRRRGRLLAGLTRQAGVNPWQWLDLLSAEDLDLEVRLALLAGLTGWDVSRLAPAGRPGRTGGRSPTQLRALYELTEGLVDGLKIVQQALILSDAGGDDLVVVEAGVERILRGLPGAIRGLWVEGCPVWPLPPLTRCPSGLKRAGHHPALLRLALPEAVGWSPVAARGLSEGGICGMDGPFWHVGWEPEADGDRPEGGWLLACGSLEGPAGLPQSVAQQDVRVRQFLLDLAEIRSLGAPAVRQLRALAQGAAPLRFQLTSGGCWRE